jgi:hypothetical protein
VAAAPIPWRPLGTLLVARGFLTEEQLDAALDEQSVSGRRLGEILVERGFIPHSTLSLALAEQYGIHPSVESGFGTGLRVLLQRPEPELQPEAPAPAVELAEPEPLPVTHLEERLEEQWAQLAAAQAQLERRRAQVVRLLARLRPQAPPGSEESTGHLVLVQSGNGYALIEREGRPPARDERLELADFPDAVFVVTTVGRSPLPHDRRACAFALRMLD